MIFGNRVYLQNLLLILKPILSSSENSGGLDDGRSKTIFTRPDGQVETRPSVTPCVHFVRRDVRVSRGHKGWRWLSGKVLDPDKFPEDCHYAPILLASINSVIHQFDLAEVVYQLSAACKRIGSLIPDLGPIVVTPPYYWVQAQKPVCRPPRDP